MINIGIGLIVVLLVAIFFCIFYVISKLSTIQDLRRKPVVSLCFEIDSIQDAIYVTLRNTGSTRADDIDIRLSPPYKSKSLLESGENNALSYIRVCSLTPGQEVRYLVDSLAQRYLVRDSIKDGIYDVSLCYKDGNKKIEDSYKIDLMFVDVMDTVKLDKKTLLLKEALETIKTIVPQISNMICEQGSSFTQTITGLVESNNKIHDENLRNIATSVESFVMTGNKIMQLVESIDNSLVDIKED
jgi:hypothetical protein